MIRIRQVEGTNRRYIEEYQYEYASVDGEAVESLSKEQISDDMLILLHYSYNQSRREYVFENDDVKVVARVMDAEVVPDEAEFVVTEITPELNPAAYQAYMDALNMQQRSPE